MRQVMLNAVDLRADGLTRESLLQEHANSPPRAPIPQPAEYQIDVRVLEEKIIYLARKIGATILIKCDVLYFREPDACFVQAVGHSLRRKTSPMLNTPESLFLSGGNQLSILH